MVRGALASTMTSVVCHSPGPVSFRNPRVLLLTGNHTPCDSLGGCSETFLGCAIKTKRVFIKRMNVYPSYPNPGQVIRNCEGINILSL